MSGCSTNREDHEAAEQEEDYDRFLAKAKQEPRAGCPPPSQCEMMQNDIARRSRPCDVKGQSKSLAD